MTKKKKIANALSKYIDEQNEGFPPTVSEFLELHKDIATELRPKLETLNVFYQRYVMKNAPENFKNKLWKKLLKEIRN